MWRVCWPPSFSPRSCSQSGNTTLSWFSSVDFWLLPLPLFPIKALPEHILFLLLDYFSRQLLPRYRRFLPCFTNGTHLWLKIALPPHMTNEWRALLWNILSHFISCPSFIITLPLSYSPPQCWFGYLSPDLWPSDPFSLLTSPPLPGARFHFQSANWVQRQLHHIFFWRLLRSRKFYICTCALFQFLPFRF